MRMAKFADDLFTDLMAEYRPTLEQTELPTPRRKRSAKPIWLTGGFASVAALVTTILLLFTAGAPAYAVTRNPDGTVTLTLNQMAALAQAAAALHAFGAPSAVGCPGTGPIEVVTPGTNTVVIDPRDVPVGQTGVLFAAPRSSGPPRLSWHVVPTHSPDCAELEKALANARKAKSAGGGR
jgi:hypothetical protein